MTEERITRVEGPTGETHTHTTVITDQPRRGGGGIWLVVIALVLVAIVGIWAVNSFGTSEAAKDNAIAAAADDVGEAAGQVGQAAQNAGEAAKDAVNN